MLLLFHVDHFLALIHQLPLVLAIRKMLLSRIMDMATVATETTVSLHFFVAGLPCLYFLGYKDECLQLCAGKKGGLIITDPCPPQTGCIHTKCHPLNLSSFNFVLSSWACSVQVPLG